MDASSHGSAGFEPPPPWAASPGLPPAADWARSDPLDRGPVDPFGLGASAGLGPTTGTPAQPIPSLPSRPPEPPAWASGSAESSGDVPSFEAIAKAARTSRPGPSPLAGPEENLPAPKGGLSPGMVAAQGMASHGRPLMAPSPRHEGNLPIPKEHASHLYDHSVGGPPSGAPGTERTGPRGAPGLTSSLGTGLSSSALPAVSSPTTGDVAPVPFDSTHYRRVFDEFVSAKTRVGEPVDGLSFESFGAKLRASEQSLIEQHACRAVRFQVLVKDRSVSLRPQLVR